MAGMSCPAQTGFEPAAILVQGYAAVAQAAVAAALAAPEVVDLVGAAAEGDGHCKDHPKDAEFLNTPIRFYLEMESIFGSTLTTGRFALGSSAPLGVNNADSVAVKLEEQDFSCPAFEAKPTFDLGEGSKATPPVSTTAGVKRKRNFSEEEILMMTNMTNAMNNVANAMLKTSVAHVDPDIYLAVMEMPEFSTEALIVAYTHLLENKAVATGFVNMSTPHRAIWLRTYLSKNYYM